MSLLFANSNKITSYPYPHDRDSRVAYAITWRPNAWQASYNYLVDDVVITDTKPGFYYECKTPGISGLTFAEDTGIVWQERAYDLLMNTGDSFSVMAGNDEEASTWFAGTDLVTIAESGVNDGTTWCVVSDVDETIDTFVLTNRVWILRPSGIYERLDRSIKVKVKEL